jgi:hypothetical protein
MSGRKRKLLTDRENVARRKLLRASQKRRWRARKKVETIKAGVLNTVRALPAADREEVLADLTKTVHARLPSGEVGVRSLQRREVEIKRATGGDTIAQDAHRYGAHPEQFELLKAVVQPALARPPPQPSPPPSLPLLPSPPAAAPAPGLLTPVRSLCTPAAPRSPLSVLTAAALRARQGLSDRKYTEQRQILGADTLPPLTAVRALESAVIPAAREVRVVVGRSTLAFVSFSLREFIALDLRASPSLRASRHKVVHRHCHLQ